MIVFSSIYDHIILGDDQNLSIRATHQKIREKGREQRKGALFFSVGSCVSVNTGKWKGTFFFSVGSCVSVNTGKGKGTLFFSVGSCVSVNTGKRKGKLITM